MGFHHVALATHDAAATHDFYTEVMGFELVKTHVGPTPNVTGSSDHQGFSKHFFYATNTDADDRDDADRELIAFWEIHDDAITGYDTNLNGAAGLPGWVNHIAFDAPTRAALDRHRVRWQQHGHQVVEIDHGFCTSIYLADPSGNMVEFCHTTRSFTADEQTDALAKLRQERPEFDADPSIIVHDAIPA